MALVAPPPNEKKRVKVYELKNNDWFDRGTGFCTGRAVNVSFLRLSRRMPEILVAAITGYIHGFPMADSQPDRTSRKSMSSQRIVRGSYCWKRRLQKMMDTRSSRVMMLTSPQQTQCS